VTGGVPRAMQSTVTLPRLLSLSREPISTPYVLFIIHMSYSSLLESDCHFVN
jgi:hypothetical protein